MVAAIPLIHTRKRRYRESGEKAVAASQRNDFNAVRVSQHHESLQSSDSLMYHYNDIIIIGHGCLIIPALFLAWWYWTKRTARRVVHGVITFTHRGRSCSSTSPENPIDAITICNGDDDTGPYFNGCAGQPSSPQSTQTNESSSYYRSWDDVLPEGSSSDSSTHFRFINWMKRTKTSRTRRSVKTTTLHNLYNNSVKKGESHQNYTESGKPIVTHILAPNNSSPTGVEMFVIEYPQQNVTSRQS